MTDSNKESDINPINVGLAEFGVYTKTSLTDNVPKTRCKWMIDDFKKCSNNNLITSLIVNIGVESATHMKESLTICCCQVDELDCPNIGDIDLVSKDIISLWHKIICRGSQLIKIDIDIDMDYNHHESNLSSYLDSLMGILKPIIGEMEISKEHLTKVEFSHLGNNPQTIMLYDIF